MRGAAPILAISLLLSAACSLTTSFTGLSTGDDDTTPPTSLEGGPETSGGDGGGSGGDGNTTPLTYRDVVLADRPLGYWRLGDTSSVARDEVGSFQGVYSGAVTHTKGALTGDDDTAAVFDGASFIDVGDVLPFVGNARYSLEVWMAPAPRPTATACALAKNVSGSGGGPAEGYALYLQEPQPTRLNLSRYHLENEEDTAGADLPYGVFTHVVGTYDGERLVLYVDGERLNDSYAATPIDAFARSLTIGASRGGTNCFFRGALDEVAIYGEALSAERIRAHHAAGLRR